MVRLYEENEIHRCNTCGLLTRVTFAAVPIEDVRCCGQLMELLGIVEPGKSIDSFKKAPVQQGSIPILADEKYTCRICGIEIVILVGSKALEMIDCCGEGMEPMSLLK